MRVITYNYELGIPPSTLSLSLSPNQPNEAHPSAHNGSTFEEVVIYFLAPKTSTGHLTTT